jgi:hypothetical protein
VLCCSLRRASACAAFSGAYLRGKVLAIIAFLGPLPRGTGLFYCVSQGTVPIFAAARIRSPETKLFAAKMGLSPLADHGEAGRKTSQSPAQIL